MWQLLLTQNARIIMRLHQYTYPGKEKPFIWGIPGCQKRSAWARLIKKVYEIDLLICKLCQSPKCIVAFITDPEQINKILRHLIKTGKSLPGLDPSYLD